MAHRILAADPHAIVRKGLESVIEAEEDLELVDQVSSVSDALDRLESDPPSLILAEVIFPDENGLHIARRVVEEDLPVQVLYLSIRDEMVYGIRALQAGADGYLMKSSSIEEMLGAIRQVLAGEVAISDAVRSQIVRRTQEPSGDLSATLGDVLTDRELEVFECLGEGLATHEIGERLYISPKTVDSHRRKIRKKMGFETNARLRHYAVLWANALSDLTAIDARRRERGA